jgi:hypothetical protein
VKDPKNRPLVYFVTGIVAIGAALYFLTLDASIFDWFILGMGVVSVYKGVQEYLQMHGGLAGIRKRNGKPGPDLDGPDDKA